MKLFSITKILNKISIHIFGIKISFKIKPKNFIKNYFKTKHSKNALVVHIMDPFLGNYYYCHSNATEGYLAAEILSQLGYNVDVLNWATPREQDFYSKYDVVYGLNLFYALFSGPKIIPYSTGMNHKTFDNNSAQRAYEFYKKTGSNPTKSTLFNENYLHAFANGIIVLGNDIATDSYKIENVGQKLFHIDGFYFDVYDIDIEKKDFESAKTHFLWWGSTGAIHKGLDIVLDVFKQKKDLTLHVCGFKDEKEKEFLNYYENELCNEFPNIINHGFVDIKSDLFKEIMNKSTAIISPSLFESGAIGIINVMANGGIIPIISKASGLDVGHYSFMYENLDNNTIDTMIDKFLSLSSNDIKQLSLNVKTESRKKYSIENYKNKLARILKEILSD